jgi:hypothetical protein
LDINDKDKGEGAAPQFGQPSARARRYNSTRVSGFGLRGGRLFFYLAVSLIVQLPHLRSFMLLKSFLRPFAVACAITATFSACSSGTKEGDTNVERGYTKKGPAATADGTANGDSATAGLTRDTVHQVTGKELYKAASDAKDRNHDGIAD